MIQLVCGKSPLLNISLARLYRGPENLHFNGLEGPALPFGLLRLTLPIFRDRLGSDTIQEVLAPHSLPLSWVFGAMKNRLSDRERLEAEGFRAQLHSNTTHSRVVKSGLIESTASVLCRLFELAKMRLVIPNVNLLDTGSLDVLRHIYQLGMPGAPDLILGYDPDWGPTRFEPEKGVSWYHSFDAVTVPQAFVHGVALLDEVEQMEMLENVSLNDTFESQSSFTSTQLDVLDDGLEPLAWDWLDSSANSLDFEGAQLIYTALNRCFHLFDFTNAFWLGIRCREAVWPHLSSHQKAIWLHAMGLSEHNRHFFSQKNYALGHYLRDIFTKALDLEDDPARRVALLYRTIVTISRRLGDDQAALPYLQMAEETLETAAFRPGDREMLQAWILNIRSYIEMKQGLKTEAIERHEAAYDLLSQLPSLPPGPARNERAYTMAVLAENLFTLNSLVKNFSAMEKWGAIQAAFTSKWPSLEAVVHSEWQSFHFQNLELAAALEHSRKGLPVAKRGFNYVLAYFFTLSALDISFRQGDLDTAREYLAHAKEFQAGLDHDFVDKEMLAHLAARIAFLDGRHELVAGHLAGIEGAAANELRALSAAAQGDANGAEALVNAAISEALDHGALPDLVEAALLAGEVALTLQRKEEAAEAFDKASELAELSMEGKTAKLSALTRMRIEWGCWQAKESNLDHLQAALEQLSKALLKSSESWWSLPPILHAFSQRNSEEQHDVQNALGASWGRLMKAKAERIEEHHAPSKNRNPLFNL